MAVGKRGVHESDSLPLSGVNGSHEPTMLFSSASEPHVAYDSLESDELAAGECSH
ncbi:hypothetical protein SAMN04487967_1390 [Natronorubrum sediminis]|uniref:Uncharacterized protein n=1 Tax=Natronorubrum sediminis TaxID=640943 RepID=A0A1H6FTZ5_9EURY|nr:hypothetical protein SAMN04487967_1390 [Natronorubrum sediminis]